MGVLVGVEVCLRHATRGTLSFQARTASEDLPAVCAHSRSPELTF